MPTPKRGAVTVPVHPDLPTVMTAAAQLVEALLRLTTKDGTLYTARPAQMADVNRTGKRFCASLHAAAASLDECVQMYALEQQRNGEGGAHVRRP